MKQDKNHSDAEMKTCPFCAEDIRAGAIKCKHCGEFLDGRGAPVAPAVPRKKLPFYFSTSFIVILLCCVGPFALPLIWFHPRMRVGAKVLWTIVVLAFSVMLYRITMNSIETIREYSALLEGL